MKFDQTKIYYKFIKETPLEISSLNIRMYIYVHTNINIVFE